VVAENSFFDQNINANYVNFYREYAFAGQGFEFGLIHYETGASIRRIIELFISRKHCHLLFRIW
jgi:hypothetical protein